MQRINVNLATADQPKEGTGFDLAIAMLILLVSGQMKPRAEQRRLILGELALNGALCPTDGSSLNFESLALKTDLYLSISRAARSLSGSRYQDIRMMLHEGDLLYLDTLDRLGWDYDGSLANGNTSRGRLGQTLYAWIMKQVRFPKIQNDGRFWESERGPISKLASICS